MPETLYAICRNNDEISVKRIPLNEDVRQQVENVFHSQEEAFRSSMLEEIEFTGNYKPMEDEVLTLPVNDEIQSIMNAIDGNSIALDILNTENLREENIKAICSTSRDNEGAVLFQSFRSSQILSSRWSLFKDNNEFRALDENVFTLANRLSAIFESQTLKFKSQHVLRSMINMKTIYLEATNAEVREFANNPLFHVDDVEAFSERTNQVTRTLLHNVMESGVLDNYDINNFIESAARLDLQIEILDGRIVLPTDRLALKSLLLFLNESRYSGEISNNLFLASSRRPI